MRTGFLHPITQETVRLYICRACDRRFTPGPPAVRNKTYPLAEILEALTAYNQGHSLEDAARRLSSRHGHAINPATIGEAPRAGKPAARRRVSCEIWPGTRACRLVAHRHAMDVAKRAVVRVSRPVKRRRPSDHRV
jgi:hypothetical protein